MESEIKNSFKSVVGAGNVKDSKAQLFAYSYDATANFQAMPDLVLSPKNTEEVQEIVKICDKEQIPIVPRGSGTNLAAGTVPTKGGIVLLFNNMNKILELDKENLTVTVQPGVITQDLSIYVEQNGLFYPPDPSSMKISTIGGNVSENSGGLRGLKYGVTKDYVKALTLVTPDGEIVNLGGKLAKDVAGYDLMSLLIGGEGTLGIITEITLKLIPLPAAKKTGIAYFNSLEDAAKTVSAIISNRIIPVTLEFMDKGTIGAVEDFMKIGLPREAEAMLLMEQDGNKEQVDEDIRQMIAIAEEMGATSVILAASEKEAASLKAGRRVALSALSRKRPTTILEDATVPRSEIAKMVRAIQDIALKYDVEISTFGHAGDGNLHPTCLADIRDKEEMERVERALDEIFHIAIELGGTITGEHGVGEMKAPYLEWKLGASGMNLMRSIKQSIDPKNIMNPGKIFAKETKKRLVIHNGQ